MKKKGHRMKNILPESIASELGLESGDVLLGRKLRMFSIISMP